MGMFDYIICEYPLPDGLVFNDFQTKDLGKYLIQYKIDKDGYLWVDDRKIKWKDSPDWVRVNTSEDIIFYTCSGSKWYQYKAIITKGKLVSLEKDYI